MDLGIFMLERSAHLNSAGYSLSYSLFSMNGSKLERESEKECQLFNSVSIQVKVFFDFVIQGKGTVHS